MRACVALGAAAVAGALLPPMAWTPLPHGTFQPEGWLYRQLRIQADGLSGAFSKFWEPVVNTQWAGGSSTTEDWVEIFPYVFAGYIPQAILLRDPAQIAQAQTWIDAIIERQTPEGWLGPPDAERGDHGMRYWPQWPIVLSFLAWHEFSKSVNGTADPRLLTSCLKWLHNASGMLDALPMGRDWSGTRWQDFVQAAQAVMDCPETPDSEQAFLQALSAKAYDQGIKNGIDWAKFYAGPDFPKDAVPGWDYLPVSARALAGATGSVRSKATSLRALPLPPFCAARSKQRHGGQGRRGDLERRPGPGGQRVVVRARQHADDVPRFARWDFHRR